MLAGGVEIKPTHKLKTIHWKRTEKKAGKRNKIQTHCTKEHWHIHVNSASQFCTSPGVGSVTEGSAIYPVPLLRTLLWNCPINQCRREAALPLLSGWRVGWLAGWLFFTLPELELGLTYKRLKHGPKGAEVEYRCVSVSSSMVSCSTLQVNDIL